MCALISYYTSTLHLQVLYQFIFFSRDKDEPFNIFQSCPRHYVDCSESTTISEAMVGGDIFRWTLSYGFKMQLRLVHCLNEVPLVPSSI